MKFLKNISALALLAASCHCFAASYGTGFLITSDGYIVTNNHVIGDSKNITIRLKGGNEIPATIVRVDKKNDLAILRISGKNYKPLSIISSSSIKRGEKVFAIGFPRIDIQGVEPKLTEGIISSLSGIKDEPTTFQISNPIQPGNSGGPLFNSDGKVIGVVVSTLNPLLVLKYSGSLPQNVNYAVKSNYLIELLNSIGSEKFLTTSSRGLSFGQKKFTEIVEGIEEGIVLIKSDDEKVAAIQTQQSMPKNQPKPVPPTNSDKDKVIPNKPSNGDFIFMGMEFAMVNGNVRVLAISPSSPTTLKKNDQLGICYNNAISFGGKSIKSIEDLKNCFRNHWSNTIFRTIDGTDRDYFGSKLMDR